MAFATAFSVTACSKEGPDDWVELKAKVSDHQAALRKLSQHGLQAEYLINKDAVTVRRKHEANAAMVLVFSGLMPNGRKPYGLLSEAELAFVDLRERTEYFTRLRETLAETIVINPDISRCEVWFADLPTPVSWGRDPAPDSPKVAVKVELTNGGRLTEEQQVTIASLVAGSFDYLEESDVRISDFNLNYYPTIDENWHKNFTIRTVLLHEQAEAARKIEQALKKYHAQASVTIQMRGTEQGEDVPLPGPDFAKSTAAVRVITDEPLTPEQLTEVRRIASDASGIPQDNIEVSQAARSPNAAKKRGGGSD